MKQTQETVKQYTGCQYFGCQNNATQVIRDSAGRRSFRCERHAVKANKRSKPCSAK